MKIYKIKTTVWGGMEGRDRYNVDYYFQNKENAEKWAKEHEEKNGTKLTVETIETED